MLGDISALHESQKDPGKITDVNGDLGGKSYGAFQFNSRDGVVLKFIGWATEQDEPLGNYGVVLKEADDLDVKWTELAETDPDGFYELQRQYAISVYFDEAARRIGNYFGVDINDRSDAFKEAVFSRTVQYSAYYICELIEDGMKFGREESLTLDTISDADLVSGIYDFLVNEADSVEEIRPGFYHSPNDWVNGSNEIVYGLKNRFIEEKEEILALL